MTLEMLCGGGPTPTAIATDVDVGTVAKLMGHRSPLMVLKHYQHVRDSQKRAAVEALPAPPTCVKNDVYKI